MSDPAASQQQRPAAQALVAERLRKRAAAGPRLAAIQRRPAEAAMALSFAQERLWFLQQLAPESPAYNVVRVYAVVGELDRLALARSLADVAARHESLRTRFPLRDGAPSPVVTAPAAVPLPVVDLANLPAAARAGEAALRHREAARRPFDLARGPLLRASWLACGEGRGDLLLVLHHIVADGWSLEVLLRELGEAYRARLRRRPPVLPAVPFQYADFALWQRQRLGSETLARLLAFWRGRLAGAPATLELPVDRPRAATARAGGAAGAMAELAIGEALAGELRQLAQRRGATLFMVLLAGFFALLNRLTGQTVLVVGLPVAGRTRSELEPVIGMFVNTLALRVDTGGELSGGELLARTREAALAAHAHEELPFEKLVEEMAPDRSTGMPPLVQAMFALDVSAAELSLPGVALARREVWSGGAKLDLDITLADLGPRLRGSTLYDRDLFDAATITRLHRGYLRVLAALAAAPGRRLAELPLLADAERHQLLIEWNDSDGGAGESASGETFPELFAAQVARCPERVAAACGGVRLTYGELERRADLLAARIADRLAPGGLAALALPRGLSFLTAMLAVWRAGSAYLPLDVEQPAQRLARLLESSGASLVLTAGELEGGAAGSAAGNLAAALGELPPAARPPLLAVAAGADRAGEAVADPRCLSPFAARSGGWRPDVRGGRPVCPGSQVGRGPSDLAYVIFTSGSTGTPKGAMLDHRGMLNHLFAKIRDLELSAADRVAQSASQTFDISVWQHLAALLTGGQVVVYPDAVARDPARLLAAADGDRITVLEVVPTVLRFLLEHCEGRERSGQVRPALSALRFIMPTGEALAPELCRRWLALYPRVPLINAYGPTECSDDVTHLVIREPPRVAGPSVSLGRPVLNLRVWVLDRLLQPVPIGVVGEICVGGRGVGRGYLGDSVRTALAFVPDPFAAEPGSRLYRTGDLGRRLDGGNLEFRGRIDHQVKVRGFRIELGEIEAALRRHPLVREAAALDFADAAGERRLIAWVAAAPGAEPAGAALREHLAGLLPDYMVPWTIAVLPELPRTPNGKTDREALRRRSSALAASAPARQRVPPRTALERELAALWLAALGPAGVREVGVTDDFFELGGNSLTGAVLINRLQERLGEVLPVVAIFEAPTIERLASFVAERHPGGVARLQGAGRPASTKARTAPAAPLPHRVERPAGPLPASFAQQRLWFLDRLQPGSPLYNIPVAFWLAGELDRRALALALAEIVRRHEALRTTFLAGVAEPMQVVAAPPPAPPPAIQAISEIPATPATPATPENPETPETPEIIATWGRVVLPLVDLAALPPGTARREAEGVAHREAARPFDLAAGPLFRAALLGVERRRHALLLNLHHVIADGWSLEVLYRELAVLYAACAAGAPPELSEPTFQYPDYAAWQRGWLLGEVFERQLAYWREALAGAPRLLELPSARPRPAVQRHRGAASSIVLPPPLVAALAALARRQGTTFFVTLLAAWKLLLYRHTGQDDLVVGTPVAGRHRRELEEMIGPCINMLAVRTRLSGDPAFPELLARVRAAVLGAYAHQDLPFERLVDELKQERNLASNPLFQVVFLLIDAALAGPALAGLAVEPLPIERGTAKFDLALACEPAAGGALAAVLEYDRDLFDAADGARLGAALAAQLAAIAAGPELPISALPSLTEAMRHQLLREWNDTAVAADRGATLHGLVARQAAKTPAAVAAVFGGGAGAPRLTYRQLAAAAGRGAASLRARGVASGSLVAVYMERCLEMVPALLGILEAGAAYVPLSTRLPPARIAYILTAMNIRHLVTHAPRRTEAESWRGATPLEHVLAFDSLVPLGSLAAVDSPGALAAVDSPGSLAAVDSPGSLDAVDPDAIAYVIFTSGSTGTPKGVVVQHRPAAALCHWVNATFGIGPGDRGLFATSLSFDLSVYDVFGLLAAGGTVRIATESEMLDPRELARVLVEESITFWDSAPAALQQLVPFLPAAPGGGGPDRPAPALSLVFLSGDWIPVGLPGRIREAFPGARVIGLGGATEATVWSNYHRIDAVPPEWKSIPYGRPIAGARYHVLDRELVPSPIGVPGELYIGGDCLAMGYAAAPEVTAWKYLPDPGTAVPGTRLYRTGDRARRWADGTLEFLGRGDRQVKVRGFRIELGEIETVLAEHPAVREAVVLAREDTPGDQRLVAYWIPRSRPTAPAGAAGAGEAPTATELRRFLASRLPDYMVPAAFVACIGWPLAPTGKLDRQALPPPGEGGRAGAGEAAGEPPRNRLERAIAGVWEEVIGLAAVGRDENFFDLGGHSLLMVRVQERLRQELGRELSMVELFQHATVAALAELLEPPAAAPEAMRAATRAASNAEPAAVSAVGSEIAIVGMAGRFPGAADLDEFWDNLRRGVESIRFFSREELLAAGVDPRLVDDPSYVPAKGALAGADLFDAHFFDYSPREAQIMDPQQRLFLECAWSAMEDAGYGGAAVAEGVGVFAGTAENTYAAAVYADAELMATVGPYQASIANKHDYLPSRVSYKLDLVGPSLNVQTACSTSLVAVHLACRSLLAGECALALAGGVSVRGSQRDGYRWEEGGIASPDGHTRAFDAAARGTVTGNGVGLVVLKRLDAAIADGDRVRAVIRGSAVNNDGSRKPGFTAPSVDGQARVIRRAQAAAGVTPDTVTYVEAHGTGTELGDPIEIAGLTQAFRAGTDRREFCAVGSVKTNIGHLDAAAGVAGLIKTVLALEHELLPPSLHFSQPNPAIDFAGSPFYVNTAAAPWPRGDTPRRAGISAFGIGGTNAHLVLEEAPPPAPTRETAPAAARPTVLLLLSAKTATALEAATANLAGWLQRQEGLELGGLADAAWTLQMGRRRFRHRRALVASGRDDALAALAPLDPRRVMTRAEPAGARHLAFLFPGQGAQRPGMAAAVYRGEPVFRAAFDRCAEILRPVLGAGLDCLLWQAGEEAAAFSALAQTALAQPALFAVEYALAQLWMSWGVRPRAMIGHSIGEYVAACLAGVFTLEDGLRLVAERGRLMQELPPGAMLAAGLPEAAAEALLAEGATRGVELAAINGPAATVFSGDGEEIERLRRKLAERGVDCRLLRTSHAFHSAAMDPVLPRFAAQLRKVALAPPRVPFVSNLTGTWITADQATDPDYWALHLRRPVRFAAGLAALAEDPDRVWVEVGPGRTLATLARQQPRKPAAAVASLDSAGEGSDGDGNGARGGTGGAGGDAELSSLFSALARLWLLGAEIDWAGVSGHERRRRVPLPTYPFERRRYWVEGAAVARPVARAASDGNGGLARAGPAGGAADENGAAAALADSEGEAFAGYAAPRDEVELTIAAAWQRLLGVERVGIHDDFYELGGSSLLAVQLASRLRQAMGVEVSPGLLFEAATVAALAEHVAAARRAAASPGEEGARRPAGSCLVRLQAAGERCPLFLVHQVGGHVFSFRALVRELGSERPLYGLRSRGLEEGEEPLATIEDMARHYVELLRGVMPHGPYLIGGASMGGMVACEISQQLLAAGEPVELLTLMDTPCGDQMPPPPAAGDVLRQVLPGGITVPAEELQGLSLPEQLQRGLAAARSAGAVGGDGFDCAEALRLLRVLHANIAALYAYQPRPYAGAALFFRAAERPPSEPRHPEVPWIELAAGGCEVHLVPGNHFTMHEPPQVREMAGRLRRRLAATGR